MNTQPDKKYSVKLELMIIALVVAFAAISYKAATHNYEESSIAAN